MSPNHVYSSEKVAKYIVALANKVNQNINITKLQKLLYIAYGVYLVVENKRLTDEHPQAWPYGPVFPITRKKLLKVELSSMSLDNAELQDIKNDQNLNSILGFVLKNFGAWTATELTEWSHKTDSPWELTCQKPNFKWSTEIPDDIIREYFSDLITINN